MKLAVIADGGFLVSLLRQQGNSQDMERSALELHTWLSKGLIQKLSETLGTRVTLFRIYYYDCYPYEGEVRHPITGMSKKAVSGPYRKKFLDCLARLPYMSLRAGRLSLNGWRIKDLSRKLANNDSISVDDIEPHYQQKEVDILISLDVCELTKHRMADSVLFLTADSDFAPLMEYARGCGLLVYLCNFGKPVPQTLLAANDWHLDCQLSEIAKR